MKAVHLVLISAFFALAVAQTCTCVQGMIFDSSATPPKCKLCCSIANVIKTAPALSVGTCNCQANYTWNSATHSCDSVPTGPAFSCLSSTANITQRETRCGAAMAGLSTMGGFSVASTGVTLYYDISHAPSVTWTEINGANPAILTIVGAPQFGNPTVTANAYIQFMPTAVPSDGQIKQIALGASSSVQVGSTSYGTFAVMAYGADTGFSADSSNGATIEFLTSIA